MQGRNYIVFDNVGIFYKKVMYIDTQDFSADKIFQNTDIKIKRQEVYVNNKFGNYIIVVAKVYKNDIDIFIHCMEQLENNKLIVGNTKYTKDCDHIMKEVLHR